MARCVQWSSLQDRCECLVQRVSEQWALVHTNSKFPTRNVMCMIIVVLCLLFFILLQYCQCCLSGAAAAAHSFHGHFSLSDFFPISILGKYTVVIQNVPCQCSMPMWKKNDIFFHLPNRFAGFIIFMNVCVCNGAESLDVRRPECV